MTTLLNVPITAALGLAMQCQFIYDGSGGTRST